MALEDLVDDARVPDCAVLYPCDAVSTERLVAEMAQHKGLAYMRTSRPKTPVIYGPDETFPIGGSKVAAPERRGRGDGRRRRRDGVRGAEGLRPAARPRASTSASSTPTRCSRSTRRRCVAAAQGDRRPGHHRRGSLRPGGLGDAVSEARRAGRLAPSAARGPRDSPQSASRTSCSIATASPPRTSSSAVKATARRRGRSQADCRPSSRPPGTR